MRKSLPFRPVLALAAALAASIPLAWSIGPGGDTDAAAADPYAASRARKARVLQDRLPNENLTRQALTPCVGGSAGTYPCSNVDLLAFMPLNSIGGGSGNDIWGWTDSQTGKEYALMGRTSGTAFVDVSDPENPVYLGNLPSASGNSTWRDMKTYADFAFIVSEASNHGIQVFDLTRLRNVVSPPVTFTADANYSGNNFRSAHNIVLNPESGFAYGVGTNTCSGGLHMVDLIDPLNPTFAGCASSDGYTHDAQCVSYIGPDPDYAGREICVNANEDTVTIFDVTNKANPVQVARQGYPGDGYTHQGWLTEDHRYYLLDDELDESFFGHNTRTRIFDVTNLDQPTLIGQHDGTTGAIDHNLYIFNDTVYQANYRSGLRILDGSDIPNGNLTEIGFFDIYPQNDSASFNGAWSVYPFFESGTIIVSGIEQGMFILRYNDTPGSAPVLGNADPGVAGVPNSWSLSGASASGTVFLFGGAQDGSSSPAIPACPGITVSIANARFAASTSADPNGDAVLTRSIPAALSGRTFRFQAVDRDTCTTSNKVTNTFQ